MTHPSPLAGASSSPESIGRAFDFRPLMAANMICTMVMMAFVAVVGPLARVLQLATWQAGAVVTIGGLLWMTLSRGWGRASDRHGRRKVLLAGVGGFTVCYWAMCALLIASLHWLPAPWLVFAGLILTRGAVGAFYAAIPTTGQALVADHVEPARRAGVLAGLGAANAVGLVLGPALAAVLARYSLALPLYATALLPLLALAVLWKALPLTERPRGGPAPEVRLTDPRLRRPMIVAFVAMLCVAIAQITVGFFAIDRLRLAPEAAAQAAGMALTLVGVGLVASQILVRKLGWPPHRLIVVGGGIGALGLAVVAAAHSELWLAAGFLVSSMGLGWVFPAFSALAANAVQAHEQGAAAGSVGAAQGLGIVVGPLVGTLCYEFGPGVPYGVAAVLLALVAAWSARGRHVNGP